MAKQLTGEQKAAILLRAIGEDAAALVMKSLDPKDIRKLGSYMKDTANITKDEESSVMTEFEKVSAAGEVQFESKEYMKAILVKALGPEKATRMLESLNTRTYPGIDALKWIDARTVAQLLRVEHPQTIAVCLARHRTRTGQCRDRIAAGGPPGRRRAPVGDDAGSAAGSLAGVER